MFFVLLSCDSLIILSNRCSFVKHFFCGAGNRVASAIYGHKKVWIVAGKNKLAPTYDEALWRARNIAAPKNAQRLHAKTPCAVKADHCYDCKSPGRICRALTVLWGAMMGSDMEVVLVNEDLGY